MSTPKLIYILRLSCGENIYTCSDDALLVLHALDDTISRTCFPPITDIDAPSINTTGDFGRGVRALAGWCSVRFGKPTAGMYVGFWFTGTMGPASHRHTYTCEKDATNLEKQVIMCSLSNKLLIHHTWQSTSSNSTILVESLLTPSMYTSSITQKASAPHVHASQPSHR